MSVGLIEGDCLDAMRAMDPESVDAIVTDPPYGLTDIGRTLQMAGSRQRGFMGKAWDGTGIAFRPETWAAALRVAKPGAYLLAFGGTRTVHRMTCAIEDAGWEIRDQLEWVYAQGFPKSLNVGKAIDKRGGAQIAWFGPWLRQERKRRGITQKSLAAHFPSKTGGMTGCVANWELGLNLPTVEQFNKLCETLELPFTRIAEADREVTGSNPRKAGWFAARDGYDLSAPSTDEAKRWDGWGTALKPAHEPIVMARKPLIGTVAANVLAYGTGAINIDGCRIEGGGVEAGRLRHGGGTIGAGTSFELPDSHGEQPPGRWPANVILTDPVFDGDCPDEVVGGGQGAKGSDRVRHNGAFKSVAKGAEKEHDTFGVADSGGKSRYFLIPKASRSDREPILGGLLESLTVQTVALGEFEYATYPDGTRRIAKPKARANTHPTVKPVALIRHLVRLVCPPGGLVLDPFAGSGTTGLAARAEGMSAVLVEKEHEYAEIVRARLNL
jgi:DNA modification methylase